MRKSKMTDQEFREYLNSIKDVSDTGCWVTNKYALDDNSRVKLLYNGKKVYIYRLAYKLFNGSIGDNLVLHKCDNSLCFNPAHLELGDQKKNMKDCVERGRKKKTSTAGKKFILDSPYNYEKLLEFIKSRTVVSEKNEWLYSGYITPAGYVLFQTKGKTYLLHRLILANKLGKRYEDISIACHRLPDGSKPQRHDLNPDHLYEGSLSENAKDANKYRIGRKLTEHDAKYIMEQAKVRNLSRGQFGLFDKEMAEKYNVAPTTIQSLRSGRSHSLGVSVQSSGDPVIKLDLNKKYIGIFNSIKEAANVLNIKDYQIYNSCISKKPHDGFYWVYSKEYSEQWAPIKSKKISVVQLDKDKKLVARYNSIREAARAANVTSRRIVTACKNSALLNNFFWIYEDKFQLNLLSFSSETK